MVPGQGRFVWFELMTTDTEGAKSFYTKLIGWKVAKHPGGYEGWTAGDRDVGGLMDLPAEARAGGAFPFWIGYVGVDDVDATVAQAKELGGQVHHAPTDIPDVGRFAALADPQGATFAIYRAKTPREPPEARAMQTFGWAELNTTDWKSAWKFYSALFGWKHTESVDMGPEFGEYFIFGTDGQSRIGGMSNAAGALNVTAHWLHYIHVPDVGAASKKLEQMGGKVLNGPMEVPGGDFVVQCRDPQGGHFALVAPKK